MQRYVARRRHDPVYAEAGFGASGAGNGRRRPPGRRSGKIDSFQILEGWVADLRALLRLFGALLLDFLHLVDQVVGLLQQGGALILAFHHVRLAAVQEIQISHGVIVIRTEGDGLLQIVDAFFDERSVLSGILCANGRRQGLVVAHLLLDILLVVLHAHFAVGAKRQGPVNHTDPVIRFRIVGLQLDVALVVGLGLFKLFGVKGLAAHLEQNGADTVDRRKIVGILVENFFKLGYGLFAAREI